MTSNGMQFRRQKDGKIPTQRTKMKLQINWYRRRSSLWFIALALCLQNADSERAYPLGCSQQPPSYYNYDSYPFPPPATNIRSTDDYLLLRRLGAGKFSDVFEAVDVELEQKYPQQNENDPIDPRTLVVLKCLKPVSERKIRRELLVLSHASRLPNLARLLGVVVPKSLPSSSAAQSTKLQPMPSLVLRHAGRDSQWLCHGSNTNDASSTQKNKDPYLSDYEIRYYLCHLLVALDALHSCGIMHRDVKPRNVLIRRYSRNCWSSTSVQTEGPLMLIDLGLADFFLPNTKYNVRVASRHYKSPELLIGYEYYDYAIDCWGVGCILAGLLLRREPFFRGKDNVDQLGKIVSVLGTADLQSYLAKVNVEITPEIRKVIAKYTLRGGQKRPWLSLLPKGCPVPSEEGVDLLDKLLVYDHDARLTAQQALRHAFFDPVRDRVMAEVQSRSVLEEEDETTTPVSYTHT